MHFSGNDAIHFLFTINYINLCHRTLGKQQPIIQVINYTPGLTVHRVCGECSPQVPARSVWLCTTFLLCDLCVFMFASRLISGKRGRGGSIAVTMIAWGGGPMLYKCGSEGVGRCQRPREQVGSALHNLDILIWNLESIWSFKKGIRQK